MNTAKHALEGQDMFGEGISMKVDGGDDQLKSGFGTFCSILLLVITGVYGYTKLLTYIKKKDVNILSATKHLFFEDKDAFGYEQGMNIAVAFTAYNSKTEYELDPSYGEIVFNSYSWGNNNDGTTFVRRTPLRSHICTQEELNADGESENPGFYQAHKSSAWLVKTYQKKLVCVDPEEVYIYGDFSSFDARQLNIQLKPCRGHDYCKSETEIRDYFAGKYLLLLLNKVSFQSEQYGKDAITREARHVWLAINTQTIQTTPFQLSESKLHLQDMPVNLDDFTEEELDFVFQMEQIQPFSYEKDKDTTMDVTFERNMDLIIIARDGYTILDWISDIGGIQGILISGAALIVGFWNYHWLENYLVSRLYRIEKQDARQKVYSSTKDRTEKVQISKLCGLRDCICNLLPSCL